jgi:hypothetical protein
MIFPVSVKMAYFTIRCQFVHIFIFVPSPKIDHMHMYGLDTKIQRGANKNSKLHEGEQWIEQKPQTYFPATSKT